MFILVYYRNDKVSNRKSKSNLFILFLIIRKRFRYILIPNVMFLHQKTISNQCTDFYTRNKYKKFFASVQSCVFDLRLWLLLFRGEKEFHPNLWVLNNKKQKWYNIFVKKILAAFIYHKVRFEEIETCLIWCNVYYLLLNRLKQILWLITFISLIMISFRLIMINLTLIKINLTNDHFSFDHFNFLNSW